MANPPGTFTSISVTYDMGEKLHDLKKGGETYSDLLWRVIGQNDSTRENKDTQVTVVS